MAWLSEAVITTIQQIMNAVMPFRFWPSHVLWYVVSSETHQEINTGRNSLKTGDVTANYRNNLLLLTEVVVAPGRFVVASELCVCERGSDHLDGDRAFF